MTLPHDQLCTACRQRPRWAARWICKPCYLALRPDLRELVDAYRRLGEAMVTLPPAWRTSQIRAVRNIEAPMPFDPELALQRTNITDNLRYWASMVLDARRPRRWPPHDVTVDVLTAWLLPQLGWITRNPVVGEFASDVRGLRVRSEQLAPREVQRLKLPLPCPQCGELSLAKCGGLSLLQRGDLIECTRGRCRHVMTLGAYHRLEDELASELAKAAARQKRETIDS